jgi:hypothetical protein
VIDQPDTEIGPIIESDIECSDNYGNSRFCKLKNVCIGGADEISHEHFHFYSSLPRTKIVGKNEKVVDEWISESWWLKYHPLSEAANQTVRKRKTKVVLDHAWESVFDFNGNSVADDL